MNDYVINFPDRALRAAGNTPNPGNPCPLPSPKKGVRKNPDPGTKSGAQFSSVAGSINLYPFHTLHQHFTNVMKGRSNCGFYGHFRYCVQMIAFPACMSSKLAPENQLPITLLPP